jgi:hypothetical protein
MKVAQHFSAGLTFFLMRPSGRDDRVTFGQKINRQDSLSVVPTGTVRLLGVTPSNKLLGYFPSIPSG